MLEVSIGVARGGELVAGVIYDPFRDELFAAAAGAGATLNGVRIAVARIKLGSCQGQIWEKWAVRSAADLLGEIAMFRHAAMFGAFGISRSSAEILFLGPSRAP